MRFYKSAANRLYPYRKYFVVFTVLPLASVCFIVFLWGRSGSTPPDVLGDIIPICMAVAAWMWGLACMCLWFHPDHGTLFRKSWFGDYFHVYPEKVVVFLTVWLVAIPILLLVIAIRMLSCS